MMESVTLLEVQRRVFRKHAVKHKEPFTPINRNAARYKEYDEEYDGDDGSCVVQKDEKKSSLFKTTFVLPKIFYKYIIGKGGSTRNKMQNETGATVNIPNASSSSEEIVVKGPTEGIVRSAKIRIDLIVENVMQELPYTHFLSIPLCDSALQQRLKTLYDDLLAKCSDVQGLESSILADPAQFHLTILMLKLYTPESLNKAQQLLRKCASKIYDLVGTRSVVAHLRGQNI